MQLSDQESEERDDPDEPVTYHLLRPCPIQ